MRVYTIGARKELVHLTRDFAQSIEPDFLTSNEKPFVIAINGDMNSGKSLIWDEFRYAVMGTIKEPLASDIQGGDILFKTWVSPHLETQNEMRLHTENINLREWLKTAPLSFAPDDLKKIGTTIMFNNLDESVKGYASIADVIMTLTVNGSPHHHHWDRTLRIETNNETLLNSPRYQRDLSIFG